MGTRLAVTTAQSGVAVNSQGTDCDSQGQIFERVVKLDPLHGMETNKFNESIAAEHLLGTPR